MDVEKRASKGGFLQLFDWNVKSRKKLFPNKSELAEVPKPGKEDVANSLILHPQLMEERENGPGPRGKTSSDYNVASSVTSDEGHGTRAPGVVARLMGLDSLPTSTISEPCSTPLCDSPFVRDSCSQRSAFNFQIERHIINNMPIDRISRNLVESRLQKVQGLPIERFQTETLPPKSAKSIPITHHRLLSPIRTPGFIPTNNVAYIMEAAAKIIEQGPPSITKGKMLCFGSSSVPLRIRDLREKMEAAQKASGSPEVTRRCKEPISFKYNKGQYSEKNRGPGDTLVYSASVGSVKVSSDSLKNKDKSVSLAVQAKVNVRRREGLAPNGNRSSFNRKEGDEVKLGQFNKSQTNMEKGVQKRTSMRRTSDVLKQNNQKQNCVANKDRVASKASVSNQQDRKAPSIINGSGRPNRASNKLLNSATGSRKMKSVAKDTGKELLSSKTKASSVKKQPVHSLIHFDGSVAESILISKDERYVKCNLANEGCLNWDIVDRKNMDVVSFTFTSPIKRSVPGSQSSGQVMEKNTQFCVGSCDDNSPDDLKNPTLSSLGLNVIGGDALSVLLEQKLKELTFRVESSHCNRVEAEAAAASAFNLQDSLFTPVINTTSTEHHNSFQSNLHKDKSSYPCDIDCTSVDGLLLKAKEKWQGLEEMEGHNSSSNNSEYGKEFDCRYPSPISNLEPSSSEGSYGSSDSKTRSISNGCKQCLLAEVDGMVDCISRGNCQPMEVESELSDSASSTSAACMGGKNTSITFSLIDLKESSNWELGYITKVLYNSELILEDFVLGQVNEVITPNLFDQLENPQTGFDENAEEYSKLRRKVLFDCVSECLELRCEQLFGGRCKAWSKWATLFRRKGMLAEELYKEISSLTSVGDSMVDELVDKDMSSWQGRWVDFEIEAFEEGVEIEKGILSSLVDELIADFLLI